MGSPEDHPLLQDCNKLLLCQATLQCNSSARLFSSPLAPNSDGHRKFRSCFFPCALEARGPPQVLLLRRWPRLPIIFAIFVISRAAHDPPPTSFFFVMCFYMFSFIMFFVFVQCTTNNTRRLHHAAWSMVLPWPFSTYFYIYFCFLFNDLFAEPAI